jgi:hypothetical protein
VALGGADPALLDRTTVIGSALISSSSLKATGLTPLHER